MRQRNKELLGGGSDPAAFLLLAVQGLQQRFHSLAERIDLDSIEAELRSLSEALEAISATARSLGLLAPSETARESATATQTRGPGNPRPRWTPEQRKRFAATMAKRHGTGTEPTKRQAGNPRARWTPEQHEKFAATWAAKRDTGAKMTKRQAATTGWTPARRAAQAERLRANNPNPKATVAPAKRVPTLKQRRAWKAAAARMREAKARKDAQRAAAGRKSRGKSTPSGIWTPARRAAHAAKMREVGKKAWAAKKASSSGENASTSGETGPTAAQNASAGSQ